MKNHAFTLIELLVVVLIIGILSAIALPQYQKAVEKSRAAEALIIVKSLADAEKIYYLANGSYTTNLSELDMGVDVDGSDYTTKHWFFSIKNVTKSVPRIYATPIAYMNDAVGEYFIGYDLLSQEFYCAADLANTKGIGFCKNYAATSSPCHHSSGDPCFYF